MTGKPSAAGGGARLSRLPVQRILPNLVTVGATCAGLTGVRLAMEGRWELAVAAVLFAGVLDMLDGRLARLLNATTDFGAHMDSLSDFVAFGVSPGLILYLWSLENLGGYGWALTLFYVACVGLRLARFNTALLGHKDSEKQDAAAHGFFQGVPAPAAAGLVMLPMLVQFEWAAPPRAVGALVGPAGVGVWAMAVALLVISTLPTFSFKRISLPRPMAPLALAGGALFLAFLVARPWMTLLCAMVLYLCLIPLSWRISRQGRGGDAAGATAVD